MKNLYYKKCSHLLHLIVTIIFIPWVVVWFACAVRVSRHNEMVARQRQMVNHEEQVELLRLIAAQRADLQQGVLK